MFPGSSSKVGSQTMRVYISIVELSYKTYSYIIYLQGGMWNISKIY